MSTRVPPSARSPRALPSRHPIRLAGLAALVLLGVSTDRAHAQYVYGYARPLPGPAFEDDLLIPPRAVYERLRDRGFVDITRPRFDGTAYVVEATHPAGDRVRLFVDARSGGLIGRQRLDIPYYPSRRVARAAPGYGWTDEDAEAGPGRGRLVPPAEIPDARPPRPDRERAAALSRPEPGLRPAPSAPVGPRPGAAEANPLGLNPDAKGPDTKGPDAKEPAARGASGEGRGRPASPRRTEGTSERRTVKPKPAAEPAADAPATAAAVSPPQAATPAAEPAGTNSGASTPAAHPAVGPEAPARTAKAQPWQDPPTEGAKRPVRVIGGATVVPGGEAPAASPN